MEKDLLIFIPTYNEKDNVRLIIEGLRFNLPGVPILFCDDNSPDGTSALLRELAKEFGAIEVVTREGKLGIGSAHKFGIRRAVEAGYKKLLTLDCDLTHQPSDAAKFAHHEAGGVVIGTRFKDKAALADWNMYRKMITHAGYLATQFFLGLPYDATGALRRYRLDRIGSEWLKDVESDGYAFFFESLMVLNKRGSSIVELPIHLPKRTYGSSKMSIMEVAMSVRMMLGLFLKRFALGNK